MVPAAQVDSATGAVQLAPAEDSLRATAEVIVGRLELKELTGGKSRAELVRVCIALIRRGMCSIIAPSHPC